MRRRYYWALCGILLITCIGCETIKGMGKDIENTGSNIQELLSGKS